jgi:hypothetical protein
MFNRLFLRSAILLLLLLSIHSTAFSQPTLPDMACVTQNGINILTWNCQYDGLKSIAVQRSTDSNFNYVTIGYVKDLKKGVQFYLDGHPKAGTNWYRITLIFGSNLAWTTNRIRVTVDSSQIAKGRVLPPNDSLQGLASSFKTRTVKVDTSTTPGSDTAARGSAAALAAANAPKVVVTSTMTPKLKTDSAAAPVKAPPPAIQIPDITEVNAYSYIKSQYVFTNPFTGHVNIELSEAPKSKFSIDFFDSDNVKVLEIPRIMEPSVIVDKRNFQRTGMYKFELYKDKVKIETGYITIY